MWRDHFVQVRIAFENSERSINAEPIAKPNAMAAEHHLGLLSQFVRIIVGCHERPKPALYTKRVTRRRGAGEVLRGTGKVGENLSSSTPWGVPRAVRGTAPAL